jgi:hypothetical protein
VPGINPSRREIHGELKKGEAGGVGNDRSAADREHDSVGSGGDVDHAEKPPAACPIVLNARIGDASSVAYRRPKSGVSNIQAAERSRKFVVNFDAPVGVHQNLRWTHIAHAVRRDRANAVGVSARSGDARSDALRQKRQYRRNRF